MIEIFEDRLEITNPGLPLIDTARFVDHPPVSRNEKLGLIKISPDSTSDKNRKYLPFWA